MLNRAFTRREKILMIIVAVILFGIGYYKFLILDVNKVIEKYDVTQVQEEYDNAQAKAMSVKKMKAEMAVGKESGSYVPSYNNMKKLIYEMNKIIGGTGSYEISFEDPVKDGDTVRRNAGITFTTTGFDSARKIINNIHNCKYKCLIREMSVSSGEGSGVKTGDVSVNMSVTFFETMYGATSQKGFAEDSQSTQTIQTTQQ